MHENRKLVASYGQEACRCVDIGYAYVCPRPSAKRVSGEAGCSLAGYPPRIRPPGFNRDTCSRAKGEVPGAVFSYCPNMTINPRSNRRSLPTPSTRRGIHLGFDPVAVMA